MSMSPGNSFSTVDDDTVIIIFSHFSILDILSTRRTCKRFEQLSRLPAVWIDVYHRSIENSGLPLSQQLDVASGASQEGLTDLEKACIYHFRLDQFWRRSANAKNDHVIQDHVSQTSFHASGTEDVAVSEVRILPGTYGKRIVTVSKGIWSTIVLWEVDEHTRTVLGRWTCQGGVFRGFVITDDPTSKNCIAVSVSHNDQCFIVILSLRPVEQGQNGLHECASLITSGVPTALRGDILAYSDAVSETVIFDIKNTQEIAVLKSSPDAIGAGFGLPGLLNNACSQVVLLDEYVFVVRARTFELFRTPSFFVGSHDRQAPSITPIAWHSFGWVESITVTPRVSTLNAGPLRPIDIYIRTKKQDLWHPQPESIEVWTLEPEPSAPSTHFRNGTEISMVALDEVPYMFPPVYQHTLPSLYTDYTSPRCRTLCSGPRGTAVYVCSNAQRSMLPTSVIDAVALDHSLAYSTRGAAPAYSTGISSSSMWSPHSIEGIVAVMLSSSAMYSAHSFEDDRTQSVRMIPLSLNHTTTPWSALDYDERSGVVALGSGDGHLVVLRLGQDM